MLSFVISSISELVFRQEKHRCISKIYLKTVDGKITDVFDGDIIGLTK